MIIDELDAKLHPKLLRYVISLFKNKNVNKRERSYFYFHDMTTMKIQFSDGMNLVRGRK